ncbi:MAG: hypothetical protein H0T84_10795 [Tatlockia sp.]|nr:hypothetical protein [Tatlockia sp.]
MARPVALLDVDHTLLFNNRLNQDLLDSLKSKHIKDLYLFTDMTFKNTSIQDRNDLLAQLQDQGFIVHAVITGNDLTWDDMSGEETSLLYQWCNDNTYRGMMVGKEFEQFIQEKKDVLPGLAKVIQTYFPDNKVPGKGYADAAAEFEESGNISDETRTRSFFAKAFADHLGEKYGYKHNKALLLDLFLRHKPAWISSLVVIDDNDDVIESISNFKAVDEQVRLPLITMLPVRAEKMGLTYYHEILQKHLDKELITKDNDLFNFRLKIHKLASWLGNSPEKIAFIDALHQAELLISEISDENKKREEHFKTFSDYLEKRDVYQTRMDEYTLPFDEFLEDSDKLLTIFDKFRAESLVKIDPSKAFDLLNAIDNYAKKYSDKDKVALNIIKAACILVLTAALTFLVSLAAAVLATVFLFLLVPLSWCGLDSIFETIGDFIYRGIEMAHEGMKEVANFSTHDSIWDLLFYGRGALSLNADNLAKNSYSFFSKMAHPTVDSRENKIEIKDYNSLDNRTGLEIGDLIPWVGSF